MYDKLLGGIERLEHLFADGLLADPGHEILDDRQADVGLQERPLHQAQAVAHVRLGQTPRPRMARNAELRFSWSDSNMGVLF